jgi:plasmid replication initiation protein
MKTIVSVPDLDRRGCTAGQNVQILSTTTITDDDDDPYGQVIYEFSPAMRAIIKDSTLWGKVRHAVVFAITSKYALSLYELIAGRINLKRKWLEEFSVGDLRALLGVPEKKLRRVPNLLQRVIRPAVLEVNGLADFGVEVEPIRKGGQERGFVTGFLISWWRKDEPELRAAYDELKQPKVGRMARLKARASGKPLASTADAL